MHLFFLISILLLSVILIYYIIKEVQEVLFLKKTLKEIINTSHFKNENDLIKLKQFLNKHIKYNSVQKAKRRPILRHTAFEILKSNYGFCGENARVAIKLLILGGIKARRLYLYRKEWQHVLVEHKWNEGWYMFDGHNDENTMLQDKDVAKINSNDIMKFPDHYPNNPYLDYCRIKFLYKIPYLKKFSKIKLGTFFVYFFESPNLIKAFLSLCIGVIIYFFL